VSERGNQASGAPAQDGPARILIVEDDDDLRSVLRQALEDEGYAVVDACDGRRALDLLSLGPLPDVILLDLMMPRMSGWDLLTKIRKDAALSRIPVTVMSTTHNAGTVKDARFLEKPLDLSVLLRIVREDLALARWRKPQ
jgi:two-component system, chemotaxis family, chemotaxis protein CheY